MASLAPFPFGSLSIDGDSSLGYWGCGKATGRGAGVVTSCGSCRKLPRNLSWRLCVSFTIGWFPRAMAIDWWICCLAYNAGKQRGNNRHDPDTTTTLTLTPLHQLPHPSFRCWINLVPSPRPERVSPLISYPFRLPAAHSFDSSHTVIYKTHPISKNTSPVNLSDRHLLNGELYRFLFRLPPHLGHPTTLWPRNSGKR
jgi:hypothetical protein